jgi:hypothetical protein
MTCKHLKDLYAICQQHQLKLSSTDLIRIVCPSCGVEEECPSVLCSEYELRHHDAEASERRQETPLPERGE